MERLHERTTFVADCPKAVPMPSYPGCRRGAADATPVEKAAWSEEVSSLVSQYELELKETRLKQANFHSQRIAARLKLDVADEFRHEHAFYFPHNIDFRGRVYAVGPHLQYLGDDLARGLLSFAQGKPLGDDGHWWLKVQLANLYGMDKLSLDERVAWSEAAISDGHVSRVATSPYSEAATSWWLSSENPVQTLAVCFELHAIHEASQHGQPAHAFLSKVPVHMDGSCNGLQHYAGLRDRIGAEQVNLIPPAGRATSTWCAPSSSRRSTRRAARAAVGDRLGERSPRRRSDGGRSSRRDDAR